VESQSHFPHCSRHQRQEIVPDDESKHTPKMFVGPQGQIYRRFGVCRQVRALPTIVYKNETAGDEYAITAFRLKISDDKYPVEDVQLQWGDAMLLSQ
jgi:hypothetical protein